VTSFFGPALLWLIFTCVMIGFGLGILNSYILTSTFRRKPQYFSVITWWFVVPSVIAFLLSFTLLSFTFQDILASLFLPIVVGGIASIFIARQWRLEQSIE